PLRQISGKYPAKLLTAEGAVGNVASPWKENADRAPQRSGDWGQPPYRIPSPAFHQNGRGAGLIVRYTRPEMGRIWSDENRFRMWLAVEVAATETLAEAGMVPKEAARAIRERAAFNVTRIQEIE